MFRALNIGTMLSLAISDRVFGAHLMNGLAAALVPDLFEPAAD